MPTLPPASVLWFVLVVPAIALAGCDDKKDDSAAPAPIEKVEGTITVGDKPAKVTGCKVVAKDKGTALELTLDTGLTIINDAMAGLQWKKGDAAPEKLTCESTSGESSAGKSSAGAWAKGKLALECDHADGAIKADLTYDCGISDRPSNEAPKG